MIDRADSVLVAYNLLEAYEHAPTMPNRKIIQDSDDDDDDDDDSDQGEAPQTLRPRLSPDRNHNVQVLGSTDINLESLDTVADVQSDHAPSTGSTGRRKL